MATDPTGRRRHALQSRGWCWLAPVPKLHCLVDMALALAWQERPRNNCRLRTFARSQLLFLLSK